MMAESLAEEQKQQDVWRILLCEIVHHVAGYLQRMDQDARHIEERQTFVQLSDTLKKLSQLPHQAGRILIRYRGITADTDIPEQMDYEILFGNMVVDLDTCTCHDQAPRTPAVPSDGTAAGCLRNLFQSAASTT
jgi:hypothetical protein